MQPLKGRKTYMGGLALIFLAIGSVMQGLSDGTDIDWNRVVADTTIGCSIIGACMHGPKSPPPKPATS